MDPAFEAAERRRLERLQSFDYGDQFHQSRTPSHSHSPARPQMSPHAKTPNNPPASSGAQASPHLHSQLQLGSASPRLSSGGLTSELLSALQDEQEDASMSNHEDGDDESMSSSSSLAMETELIIQQAFEDANSMSPPNSVAKPLPEPSELSVSRQQFDFVTQQQQQQQQQQDQQHQQHQQHQQQHQPQSPQQQMSLLEPMPPPSTIVSPPMNPSTPSNAFGPQTLELAANAASSPNSPSSGLMADGFPPSAFEIRRRKAQRMWLKVQFAPAMSKVVRSQDPSLSPLRMNERGGKNFNLMDDDEDDEDEDERQSNSKDSSRGQSYGRPSSPRRNTSSTYSQELHGDSAATNSHQDSIQEFSVKWASPKDQGVDKEGYQLTIAHQEYNGLQLRLWSNEDFAMSSDTSNWFLAQGHLPRARVQLDLSFVSAHLQVKVFPIGYVCDENDQYVMEYLDSQACSITSSREQALYIRVYASEEVPSGQYEVPVRIFTQLPGFEDEELSWTSVLHIKVASLVLPLPKDWSFHLDLWQHLTSIARAHRVSLWSEQHFSLIDKYLALLSQLGQKAISVVATEMPWSGQQCHIEEDYPSALYEHSLLEVYEDEHDARTAEQTADGSNRSCSSPRNSISTSSSPSKSSGNGSTVTGDSGGRTSSSSPRKSFSSQQPPAPFFKIDFRHLDRLLTMASSYHMMQEIEIFGLMSIWRDFRNGFDGPVRDPKSCDLWRIRCFNRQTHKFRYLKTMEEIERFIRLLYEHFVARNLVDHVRICADEPHDLKLFYEQMNFLRPLAPLFKYKVAINHYEFMSYAPPEVLDYVPYLPLACADVSLTENIKRQIHAKGGKMCWYVCCGPNFPNQFVSSPLVEGELIGLLTFFLKLDGFLRWNYCLWPAQPWQNLKWRASSWKVGDMYFVLPGLHGAPVETLRFESLRFALQVYELLKMASKVLPQAQAQPLLTEIASMVFRTSDYSDFANPNLSRHELFSLDPMDYQRARTLLIETLASTPTPKATTATPPPMSSPSPQ